MTLRRPFLATAVALSLGGGLAGCFEGDSQTRNSNPGVEEDRLDQRRAPPDASNDPAAPTDDGTTDGGGSDQGSGSGSGTDDGG